MWTKAADDWSREMVLSQIQRKIYSVSSSGFNFRVKEERAKEEEII